MAGRTLPIDLLVVGTLEKTGISLADYYSTMIKFLRYCECCLYLAPLEIMRRAATEAGLKAVQLKTDTCRVPFCIATITALMPYR